MNEHIARKGLLAAARSSYGTARYMAIVWVLLLVFSGSAAEALDITIDREGLLDIGQDIMERKMEEREVSQARSLIADLLEKGTLGEKVFLMELLEECRNSYWLHLATTALEDPNSYIRLRAAMCMLAAAPLSSDVVQKCRQAVESVDIADAVPYYEDTLIELPQQILDLEKAFVDYGLCPSTESEERFLLNAEAILSVPNLSYYPDSVVRAAQLIARSGSTRAFHLIEVVDATSVEIQERVAEIRYTIAIRLGYDFEQTMRYVGITPFVSDHSRDKAMISFNKTVAFYAETGCLMSAEDVLFFRLLGQ